MSSGIKRFFAVWLFLLLVSFPGLTHAQQLLAFNPTETKTIAASTVTASATLSFDSDQVRIYNDSAAIAFVRWTTAASSAVITDVPVVTKGTAVFTKPPTQKIISVILSTGTGNVYVSSGEGF